MSSQIIHEHDDGSLTVTSTGGALAGSFTSWEEFSQFSADDAEFAAREQGRRREERQAYLDGRGFFGRVMDRIFDGGAL